MSATMLTVNVSLSLALRVHQHPATDLDPRGGGCRHAPKAHTLWAAMELLWGCLPVILPRSPHQKLLCTCQELFCRTSIRSRACRPWHLTCKCCCGAGVAAKCCGHHDCLLRLAPMQHQRPQGHCNRLGALHCKVVQGQGLIGAHSGVPLR